MADERVNVKITPAFEYGYGLGQLKLGIERMMQQIGQGFQAALNPQAHMSQEQLDERIERTRQALYERRIEHERQLGRAFVRHEVRKLRRELGLDPNDLVG